MARRMAGTSVLTLLVVAGLLLGVSVAWAADAMFVQAIDGSDWEPPSNGDDGHEFSGIAHLGNGMYLVVDTNFNDEDQNGWILDGESGDIENVATGVDEPTGVDYDPVNDRVFITDDDGFMTVITGFNTSGQSLLQWQVTSVDPDTEDPVWDPVKTVLFWIEDGSLHWYDPGPDNSFVMTGDDSQDSFSVDLPVGDFESLARDPATGNLLIGDREDNIIHEVVVHDHVTGSYTAHSTIDATSVNQLFDISGLGVGQSSFSTGVNTLWAVSRDGKNIVEMTFDGTVPPPPPPTTTTTTLPDEPTTTVPDEPTTTTPGGTTTTSTTTPGGGGTTTTTIPGSSTTTTAPGGSTTTTQPGSPPTTPPPSGGFADTQGNTFESAISWLADEGITKGCNPPDNTLFCPDDPVTRGQMAAFLGRAFEYTDAGSGSYFVDTAGNTFKTDIDRLRVAGVTQGCNPSANDRYCPDDFVTRGQMAAFLTRAFGFTDGGAGNFFTDNSGSVFETDIDRLRVAGVTLGCNPPANDNYCPNDLVTRGQMAAFLQRGFGQ